MVPESAPTAEDYETIFPPMDRQNLFADAPILGRPRKGLVADSVVDDLAVSLLLPRSQDEHTPAGVRALRRRSQRLIRTEISLQHATGCPSEGSAPRTHRT